MKTGYRGTFVISWAQTEVDGLRAAPLDMMGVGVTWRWTGTAVRVDGPQGVLILSGDCEVADLRRRAARTVRRLVGAALADRPLLADVAEPDNAPDQGFVLTDGRRSYSATLIDTPDGGPRLLMFVGEMPEEGTELWVVRAALPPSTAFDDSPLAGGVICFTPGTRIATPDGSRRIETLAPGERILTKDDGPQEVIWAGHRKMTGARLFAMPHLRPVRLTAGALGIERPEDDLLVSPQHRMLVSGAAAQALFNDPEVLVTAKDLVNGRSIYVDTTLREVTYVHILLARHQVVWANGLETESFHPSNTSLETVNPVQRAELLALFPGLDRDPDGYGGFARRNLTTSEAAILRYEVA
jgi:hypothetical protein